MAGVGLHSGGKAVSWIRTMRPFRLMGLAAISQVLPALACASPLCSAIATSGSMAQLSQEWIQRVEEVRTRSARLVGPIQPMEIFRSRSPEERIEELLQVVDADDETGVAWIEKHFDRKIITSSHVGEDQVNRHYDGEGRNNLGVYAFRDWMGRPMIAKVIRADADWLVRTGDRRLILGELIGAQLGEMLGAPAVLEIGITHAGSTEPGRPYVIMEDVQVNGGEITLKNAAFQKRLPELLRARASTPGSPTVFEKMASLLGEATASGVHTSDIDFAISADRLEVRWLDPFFWEIGGLVPDFWSEQGAVVAQWYEDALGTFEGAADEKAMAEIALKSLDAFFAEVREAGLLRMDHDIHAFLLPLAGQAPSLDLGRGMDKRLAELRRRYNSAKKRL